MAWLFVLLGRRSSVDIKGTGTYSLCYTLRYKFIVIIMIMTPKIIIMMLIIIIIIIIIIINNNNNKQQLENFKTLLHQPNTFSFRMFWRPWRPTQKVYDFWTNSANGQFLFLVTPESHPTFQGFLSLFMIQYGRLKSVLASRASNLNGSDHTCQTE